MAAVALMAGKQAALLPLQHAAVLCQMPTAALQLHRRRQASGMSSVKVPAFDVPETHMPQRTLGSITRMTTAQQVPFALRGFATQASAMPDAGGKAAPAAAGSGVPESEADAAKDRKLGARGSSTHFAAGYVAPHPSMGTSGAPAPGDGAGEGLMRESFMPRHVVYDMAYLESVKPIHLPPKTMADRLGLYGVKLLRGGFDLFTGYGANMTEAKWLQRILFLETVAGVPGMVGGMLRHLHSLRLMRRDKGWIHCLLEEAENERMHLITFMELRKPGPLFRAMVLLAQGIFFNAFFIAYLIWPQVCHAFVGYLEEEAVRTYTHALRDIDEGKLWKGVTAPAIAQTYWGLAPNATMRELILAVRADEACHSHVNHTLKAVKQDAANPFALGRSQLP